jgi:hypothetical protein
MEEPAGAPRPIQTVITGRTILERKWSGLEHGWNNKANQGYDQRGGGAVI